MIGRDCSNWNVSNFWDFVYTSWNFCMVYISAWTLKNIPHELISVFWLINVTTYNSEI
jgi:hypothetical protein